MTDTLIEAARAGARLTARGETIAIAESSAGGLIAARLLAVAGASAYFAGGTVIYTLTARRELLGIDDATLARQQPLTEAYVRLCADAVRTRLDATWGLSELGTAGPSGSPYGHPPGICVLAVVGPVTRTRRLETGSDDRVANMETFTRAAIALLEEAIDGAA